MDAFFLAANLAVNINRSELAIRIFKYLAVRNPLGLWVHWNLGWTYLEAGQVDDALRSYATAISLNHAIEFPILREHGTARMFTS